MRRIIFLKTRFHHLGGLEKYTLHLMQAFAEQSGCQVTLLTTGQPPKLKNIQSISLIPDSKFSLYQLTQFDRMCKKWLASHSHDFVFGMERTTTQTHYRAGSGVHATYLKRRSLTDSLFKQFTFSFNPLHRKLLSMEREAFEHPKLQTLFTNSKMVKQEILSTYSIPSNKLEVVHNGVEWKKWTHEYENSFFKKEHKPFEFLFIGNGYRRKGLLFLLKGLAQIQQKEWRLTVIGKDKNQKLFKNFAEKLGLQDRVIFLGPQPQIIPFYQKADALAIPSIYDPFANVTVEALAMGVFVISSAFNGGKEVLHSFSGEIIEDLCSEQSIAKSLKNALDHPKTEESASKIRQSIKELDFSNQLDKIVAKTLCS